MGAYRFLFSIKVWLHLQPLLSQPNRDLNSTFYYMG